jgi:shikimate dehydrogenase
MGRRIGMKKVRLGLIGDNIARSHSPRLHVAAGKLSDLDVTYERLIPADLDEDFDAVFARCRSSGFVGINITYPYKERVFGRVHVEHPAVAAIGACNTIVFGEGEPTGHNTDYTGFMQAFRRRFSDMKPGSVAMVGAGGVGKAVAFGLADLGCASLRIHDRDARKTADLVRTIKDHGVAMDVVVVDDAGAAVAGAQGAINCTPLGMVGHPGSAVPRHALAGVKWAFDAVYTPIDTEFLTDAADAGASILSGYELFFHQGVDAFRIFTGCDVDEPALRELLGEPEALLRLSA